MALIICTPDEYEKLAAVLNHSSNQPTLRGLSVIYEMVQKSPAVPPDYLLDTETEEFWVYRHKYTGKEIHLVKNPEAFLVEVVRK
jgi:hypothetical protein